MATEVIRMDPSGIDGDCDTSSTDTRFAGNGQREVPQSNDDKPDAPMQPHGGKRGHNHQHAQHHHRRKPSKKKRKWKPYSKMTWEEKKAVEEKEKLRADRIRDEMIDRGRPVAPYNTTQFIMNEHDPYEEDAVTEAGTNCKGNDGCNETAGNDACSSVSSTSGVYSAQLQCNDSPRHMDELLEAEYTDSPHMAPEFISQDFSEAYERVQEESLSTMSRDDLVKEHLSLERTLSYLQEKLAEEKGVNNSYSVKVQNIEEELEVLRKDNTRLVRENMCLRYGEDSVKNEDFVENETFRTTDDEYEAPNDENETTTGCVEPVNITEKTGEVHSMDVLNDEDLKCNRDYTEKMHVTNDSTLKSLPVTQLMSSDQERNYEADDALSEEHVSPQTTEARKKRRNLKNRSSSQHNHRKDDTNSSLDEDATNEGRRFGKQKKEDAVDINENLCPDNHLETIESLQSNKEVRLNDKFCNSSHLSCTSANMNGDNNLDTTRNPTKISVNNCKDSRFESETTVVKVQQSFPDSMDAESYSWGDDNGEGTATMESLESDNN